MGEIEAFWVQNLEEIVMCMDHRLVQNKFIDTKNSGSTGLLAVLHKDFVACASLGDSQAFLYSKSKTANTDFHAEELSTVHTPDDPDEKARILSRGGTVRRVTTKNGVESGPLRVFQGNTRIPGLMMTRSFGDELGHSVGLISRPSKH